MFAGGGWFVRESAQAAGIPLVRRAVGASSLSVYVPAHPDALLEALTEEEFRASDERLPYFSTLWPAGESLALAVLDGPSLAERRVLDLGCGVGAAGLAALVRGGRVTFLDWEPRTLEVVRLAATAQHLPEPTLVAADWRRPPELGRFDLILAADVLYESRNVPAVAAFLAHHLEPAGEAWISDPGRPGAETLEGALGPHGLERGAMETLATRADGIVVHLHRVAFPA